MKLIIYSVVLNHHQAPVADALYRQLGNDFRFVETTSLGDAKGADEDYSRRPYLLRAWQSESAFREALAAAETADVCLFGGNDTLPYMRARMKKGLLSFQVGERWLKRGWKNLLSPRLLTFLFHYHLGGWARQPFYKLCASAYAAADDRQLGLFRHRHFKWGYFTSVDGLGQGSVTYDATRPMRLMWCSRFIDWKHPEQPLHLAKALKGLGKRFVLDMYGYGVMSVPMQQLAKRLGVEDVVTFRGNVPNSQVRKAMQTHDVFLFTSDRNEGWGAVLNEAMTCGCVPVASDAIGAVPYLIRDKENGLVYRSGQLDSLKEKVLSLMEHPEQLGRMSRKAQTTMLEAWSPACAANRLLQLIADLRQGKDSSLADGPCSKA